MILPLASIGVRVRSYTPCTPVEKLARSIGSVGDWWREQVRNERPTQTKPGECGWWLAGINLQKFVSLSVPAARACSPLNYTTTLGLSGE